ncbi:hypothetical protein TI04_13230, partial [Achromatium sp. WMS2]
AIDNPTYYTEVVFCGYGEPTLRLKVLLEVAKFIKQHGGQVRVNTDGLADLVHKGKALPALVASGVRCAEVIFHSLGICKVSSISRAACIVGKSESDPMSTATNVVSTSFSIMTHDRLIIHT